ncbi:trimeric intracellular cation channel family protein [Nannocystis radixulma]|uniref:TRIC cation channel family protein n=1 Tax=Nannocystis radixulma TaxID=2995305 RepID=A0ABT5B531_9BACT|nr:TRIC cation channel family protein [Nannocystis radixulma]MDC0669211.1 TRIC cation channel family protein [Nannocystis radixulma]
MVAVHPDEFLLPLYFDLGATLLFGLSGALLAARRGYDPVGLFVVALATGVGGGLLRDGLFLQQGPPVCVQDGRYLLVVLIASVCGYFFAAGLDKIRGLLFVVDALGLGIYAVVGVQKSLALGLGVGAASFIGVINAVGGGLLRDVLVREEPFLFKPGEYYALVAGAGATLFCLLTVPLAWPPSRAAAVAIAVTFALRVVSHRLGWTTPPARTGPHPRAEAKPRVDRE